jgi:hypothetical protein
MRQKMKAGVLAFVSTFTNRSSETEKNAAIPPAGRDMAAANRKDVQESMADAFGRFDRSVDDIKAAIRGNPRTVTSTVIRTNTSVTDEGKIIKEKSAPKSAPFKLDFPSFVKRPAQGEQEVRRNDSLRSIVAGLAQVGTSPGLPGHEEAGAIPGLPISGKHQAKSVHENESREPRESSPPSGLLNKVVCSDSEGTIFLHQLQNKVDVDRIQQKLTEERAAGKHDTEDHLISLITDLQNFGRSFYLHDKDAPLEVLHQRLVKKQNQLNDLMSSRDGQGTYAARATANDEQAIANLKKEIKTLKEIIFARSHQLALQSGKDNEKLKGKSTARRLYYTAKRYGASNYLKSGEKNPLMDELGRLFSNRKSDQTDEVKSDQNDDLEKPGPLMREAVQNAGNLHHVWNPTAIAHVQGLVTPVFSWDPVVRRDVTSMRMGFMANLAADFQETHSYLDALAALKAQQIALPPELRELADRAETLMASVIGKPRGERTETITFKSVSSPGIFSSGTDFANGLTIDEGKRLGQALEEAAKLGEAAEKFFKKAFPPTPEPTPPASAGSEGKSETKRPRMSASDLLSWRKLQR